MGIRIALGARRGHILSHVGAQGVALAVVGVVLASATAAALAPLVQPLLFQTSARSIAVYALVAAVVVLVGAAPSLIPATGAARVSPMVVIRSE